MMLNNVDVTDWTADTLLQFRIGIHITRTQRDWLIINLKYPESGEVTLADWACIDAFHQKNMRFESWDDTQVLVDSYQNCYLQDNQDGATEFVKFQPEVVQDSRRVLQDGRTLANISVHIMRPFYTVDMDGGDVQLDKDQHVALQLSVEWETNLR